MIESLNPLHLRAEMARRGLAPMQMWPWWSPDTDRMIDPLNDPVMLGEIRRFMAELWSVALPGREKPPGP